MILLITVIMNNNDINNNKVYDKYCKVPELSTDQLAKKNQIMFENIRYLPETTRLLLFLFIVYFFFFLLRNRNEWSTVKRSTKSVDDNITIYFQLSIKST